MEDGDNRSDLRFTDTDERRENRLLNNEEFAARKLALDSRPLALFIELTKNCNLHCPMCRTQERPDPDLDLDRDLYERIADELFDSATLVDLRGWGESTMLPDFGWFSQLAAAHRAQLRLVTNAQINRRSVWDELMAVHAIVVVSCDAADPDLFAHLRAGGTIRRLENCLGTLVELRDAYEAPAKNVLLSVVASPFNLDDLENVVTLAARHDVRKVILFPAQSNLDEWALASDEDRVRKAYDRVTARGRVEGVEVQLGAAPTEGLVLPELVKQAPCMHPWSYAYINHGGSVGFCDHLIGESRYVFASLYERSFEDIWNGPEWQDLRKRHLTGDLDGSYPDCQWCYRQRYVDFEHEMNPLYGERRVSTDTRVTLLPAPVVLSRGPA